MRLGPAAVPGGAHDGEPGGPCARDRVRERIGSERLHGRVAQGHVDDADIVTVLVLDHPVDPVDDVAGKALTLVVENANRDQVHSRSHTTNRAGLARASDGPGDVRSVAKAVDTPVVRLGEVHARDDPRPVESAVRRDPRVDDRNGHAPAAVPERLERDVGPETGHRDVHAPADLAVGRDRQDPRVVREIFDLGDGHLPSDPADPVQPADAGRAVALESLDVGLTEARVVGRDDPELATGPRQLVLEVSGDLRRSRFRRCGRDRDRGDQHDRHRDFPENLGLHRLSPSVLVGPRPVLVFGGSPRCRPTLCSMCYSA